MATLVQNIIKTIVDWYLIQEDRSEDDLTDFAERAWESSEPLHMACTKAEFLKLVDTTVHEIECKRLDQIDMDMFSLDFTAN